MRHVDPPRRPRGWQTRVLKAGRSWLDDTANGDNRNAVRPKALWGKFREQIGAAFGHICCYTTVYVANGEADHFVPWQQVRGTPSADLAYEWSNIRYADCWINRSKGTARFPDPFIVQDDWFELQLPSLELRATGKHPPGEQQGVDNLLKRVCSDVRVMKTRRLYLAQYQAGIRTLELVDEHAPLLGRALRANPEFLLPADRARLATTSVKTSS